MPEVTRWGRGKPSKEKIAQTAQQIRDGWTLPEGMKIPASVQAILNPPVEMASQFMVQAEVDHGEDGVNPLVEDKPRRTAKFIAQEARTAHVVRVRTAEDYPPVTNPVTIAAFTLNYRQFVKWFAEGKATQGMLETAEKHYMRIPEGLRNRS